MSTPGNVPPDIKPYNQTADVQAATDKINDTLNKLVSKEHPEQKRDEWTTKQREIIFKKIYDAVTALPSPKKIIVHSEIKNLKAKLVQVEQNADILRSDLKLPGASSEKKNGEFQLRYYDKFLIPKYKKEIAEKNAILLAMEGKPEEKPAPLSKTELHLVEKYAALIESDFQKDYLKRYAIALEATHAYEKTATNLLAVVTDVCDSHLKDKKNILAAKIKTLQPKKDAQVQAPNEPDKPEEPKGGPPSPKI